MPVTLRANDTKGGDQEAQCRAVGVALKPNCLIHHFSWGCSRPDSFPYLSWQVMQPPIGLGGRKPGGEHSPSAFVFNTARPEQTPSSVM